MKTVAVLGGGPAGSFAAERLAQAGLKTVLFDEKLAWEKPCGGGLTYKAYSEYPFLSRIRRPKKTGAPDGHRRAQFRRSQDGFVASSGDFFAPGSQPHAAGAGGTRGRGDRDKPAFWESSGAIRGWRCERATASPKPIFASSRPAPAIPCARSARNGAPPTP